MSDEQKNGRTDKMADENGADQGDGHMPPEDMTEEQLRAELEKQFRQQKVPDVLMQYMVSLSTLAYAKMGITDDTQDVKDLEQARMAIDSFKSLLDAVGDRFSDQDSQALAGALASMQMTFVQASESGKAAGGGKAEAEAGGDKGSAEDAAAVQDTGASERTADDSSHGKGAGETSGKKGDDPASRLWVPGKD